MHESHRRIIIAAFGCLVAVQAEASTPTARNGVTITGDAAEAANGKNRRALQATWPTSIKEGEKASRAECGTAEKCRSDHRDYSDLRAQWKAAEAASAAERASWWQTWIAAVGVLLLIWTLWETRRIAQRQLRAYVYFGDADEPFPTPITRDSRVYFKIKNVGLSPALDMRLSRAADLVTRPIGNFEVALPDVVEHIRTLPPNSDINIFLDLDELSKREFASIKSDQVILWRIRIDYKTIFGASDFDDRTLFFSKAEMAKGNIGTVGQQERQRA